MLLCTTPCVAYASFLFPSCLLSSFFFFFNDTATTEIYTLSLHDALPIYHRERDLRHRHQQLEHRGAAARRADRNKRGLQDRKSTRLNSSHTVISYAVFCLKKKKTKQIDRNSTN